jgi:hypothetical protein
VEGGRGYILRGDWKVLTHEVLWRRCWLATVKRLVKCVVTCFLCFMFACLVLSVLAFGRISFYWHVERCLCGSL